MLPSRSIFLLAGNPAFGAILSQALTSDGYEVASFTSVSKLATYLKYSTVDVVVLDTDVPGAPAVDVARGLRQNVQTESENFSIVALTRASAAFHKPLLAAGVDAVLNKPVTPAELSALLRRIAPISAEVVTPTFRPAPMQRVGNVIPLFGEGRMPRVAR
jgi:DNA-binding response OmpR family regulator